MEQEEEELTTMAALLEKSTREKLASMQKSLSECAWQQTHALGHQRGIKQALTQCDTEAMGVKNAIKTAEIEQMRLAALEDFENAASLNDVMDSHRANLRIEIYL
jgi:ABC-type transport system involved in cytochrome c biogenesis ATPase subunit